MKIYLVDDDILCLTLYQQFLTKLNYIDITTFTSGEDCLDHLHEQPELIFLDYNMEGLNGIEVLKKIKQFDRNILLYIISGQEDPAIASQSLQAGAIDYIVKSSLNPEKMKSIMQQAEELRVIKERPVKKSFFEKVKSGLGI